MTLSPGYTNEQIIEIIEEYLQLPFGQKGPWLSAQSISIGMFRRWRRAYEAGTLELGLVPRASSGRNGEMNEFSERSVTSALARQRAAHDEEIARMQERIDALQAGNEALGKAIGFLREQHAQEPDTSTEPTAPESNSTNSKHS